MDDWVAYLTERRGRVIALRQYATRRHPAVSEPVPATDAEPSP